MERVRNGLSARGAEASLVGLAIAFFTLAGSQGEPRALETFGLVLATPAALIATAVTRRAWIAALFLIFFGVVIRGVNLDGGFGSDVLPVTDAAIDRLLGGDNPYGQMYSVFPFFGPGNPLAYPPGELLYYLPGSLLDDVRATEVFSSGLILAGLAWVAWLIRSDGPVAAMGLYAAAPPLIALATDGSNDTSAGALLFIAVLLLLVSKRRSNGMLLVVAALVMGEALAFKQYTLPFWPFLIAYLAGQRWNLTLGLGPRVWRLPAWLSYGALSGGFAALVSLPFFVWSPDAFVDDLLAPSSADTHPFIDGWNVWVFLSRWLEWNAQDALGGADVLTLINVGLLATAIMAGLLFGVKTPYRAVLFGSAAWFTLMLFGRWTTYAYFAGVAPVVLLIPFADRLVEAPAQDVQEADETVAASSDALLLGGGGLKD